MLVVNPTSLHFNHDSSLPLYHSPILRSTSPSQISSRSVSLQTTLAVPSRVTRNFLTLVFIFAPDGSGTHLHVHFTGDKAQGCHPSKRRLRSPFRHYLYGRQRKGQPSFRTAVPHLLYVGWILLCLDISLLVSHCRQATRFISFRRSRRNIQSYRFRFVGITSSVWSFIVLTTWCRNRPYHCSYIKSVWVGPTDSPLPFKSYLSTNRCCRSVTIYYRHVSALEKPVYYVQLIQMWSHQVKWENVQCSTLPLKRFGKWREWYMPYTAEKALCTSLRASISFTSPDYLWQVQATPNHFNPLHTTIDYSSSEPESLVSLSSESDPESELLSSSTTSPSKKDLFFFG